MTGGGIVGRALALAVISVGGVAVLALAVRDVGAAWLQVEAPVQALLVAPAPRPPAAVNSLSFAADARGHVYLDAWVNGASVRFLVDTGSSRVVLTPQAAADAGIGPADLAWDHTAATAAGTVRAAQLNLRELRIEQLTLYDVPASVIENVPVSLLGMTALGRLRSWEMHDGVMTISW